MEKSTKEEEEGNLVPFAATSTEDLVKKYGFTKKKIEEASEEFERLSKRRNETEYKFPTDKNSLANVCGDDKCKKTLAVCFAKNTRPVVHECVVPLLKDFLQAKRKHGTRVEKQLYATMDISEFVTRLIRCRPLMFMNKIDLYILRDGKSDGVGREDFDKIGTEEEKAPFILKDYLSYDEMEIGTLISVSTPTFFINDGSRNNRAEPASDSTSHEHVGVYIAQVRCIVTQT
jgi:hypothetical protein